MRVLPGADYDLSPKAQKTGQGVRELGVHDSPKEPPADVLKIHSGPNRTASRRPDHFPFGFLANDVQA